MPTFLPIGDHGDGEALARRRGGSVALGWVALEKLAPMVFGRVTRCRRVFEDSADGELGEHFAPDAAEDFGEVDLAGVGVGGAWTVELGLREETCKFCPAKLLLIENTGLRGWRANCS